MARPIGQARKPEAARGGKRATGGLHPPLARRDGRSRFDPAVVDWQSHGAIRRRITLRADKACDAAEFAQRLRDRDATPHIAAGAGCPRRDARNRL